MKDKYLIWRFCIFQKRAYYGKTSYAAEKNKPTNWKRLQQNNKYTSLSQM